MHIAIDGTAPVTGGGVTYLRELIPALYAEAPAVHMTVFLRAGATNTLPLPPQCRRMDVWLPARGWVIWRFAWQQLVLPLLLRRIGADVLLAPYDTAPLWAPCRVVLGIQNAGPYGGPPPESWGERVREAILRRVTSLAARRAARIFFVSAWTRQVIGTRLGLPADRSCVIHLAVSDRFGPAAGGEAAPVGEPYALVVGSIRPHKDYATVLECWRRLRERWRRTARVVFVGHRTDRRYYMTLRALADRLGLGDQVVFLPEVPAEGLAELYRGASLLLLPSYVESFGLPIVEAMACGLPVIATDIPVAREVGGEAVLYYRAGDPDDLAATVGRVLSDRELCARLIETGRLRATAFSWRKTAHETLNVLREAAESSGAVSGGGWRHGTS